MRLGSFYGTPLSDRRMWVGPVIVVASTAIQLAAAVVAVRLMRVTGRKWAWALIATALVLRVYLRAQPMYRAVTGDPTFVMDFHFETFALVISILFLAGLAGIAPLFRAFSHSEEELQAAHRELERRVKERTAQLAMTNEELEQERYLLHTLMDYLPPNIYFKDQESRFIRINKAMARFFGLHDPSEAIGKTDLDFFTDEHAVQALADEREILRTGRPILDQEEKETWPDGHTTWASTTKMPLFDEDGKNMSHGAQLLEEGARPKAREISLVLVPRACNPKFL